MSVFLLSLAFVAQDPQPPVEPPPLQAEGPPERSLSPAHDVYYEDSAPPTNEARIAIQEFGTCVARRSAGLAAEVLTRDFTSRSYETGLRRLARSNEDCFRRRGRMRSGNLLFAGAIAEHLLEHEPEPLNVRLARAALRPATPSYSVVDRAAICVVRSVPDDVARLFATEVTSDAETTAARALNPVMAACNGDGPPIEVTTEGLRSILATAAFRELQLGASSAEARN